MAWKGSTRPGVFSAGEGLISPRKVHCRQGLVSLIETMGEEQRKRGGRRRRRRRCTQTWRGKVT